jgi:hypothetical protein
VTAEIVVVVPVLNRPQNAHPVAISFARAQTVPSSLLFVTSLGDDAQHVACRVALADMEFLSGATGDILTIPDEPGPGDFARKINAAYRLTREPFLFQAADDVEFEHGWDAEVLKAQTATGAGVVGTNDDGNRRVIAGLHSTHTLIARRYVDEQGGSMDGPGTVFSESYGHQYADTELVELAKVRAEWAFAPRAVVRHNHPFWGRGEMDDTYRKGQATGAADRRLYLQRERTFR